MIKSNNVSWDLIVKDLFFIEANLPANHWFNQQNLTTDLSLSPTQIGCDLADLVVDKDNNHDLHPTE